VQIAYTRSFWTTDHQTIIDAAARKFKRNESTTGLYLSRDNTLRACKGATLRFLRNSSVSFIIIGDPCTAILYNFATAGRPTYRINAYTLYWWKSSSFLTPLLHRGSPTYFTKVAKWTKSKNARIWWSTIIFLYFNMQDNNKLCIIMFFFRITNLSVGKLYVFLR